MVDQIDINVRDADIEDRDRRISELEEENKRLREALEAIVEDQDGAAFTAQQALETKTPPEG